MSRPEANIANTVSLVIPARAEYLVFCRLALVGLAQTKNIEAETLADMKLAVTEACSNSIRHAYEEGGGTVSVRFTLEDEEIAIEVEDQGDGFEPQITRPFSPNTESGMGLAIIEALTDELTFSAGTNGSGSLVTFRKRL
jgi:serine/threonine-protein kinase RsbW